MAARRLRLDRTLGPLVVSWIEKQLVHGPGDVQGQRIELDDEFVRFVFAAYAIDDYGRRLVRRAVFSRSKGRAKSEFASMLVCAEGLGPVRFRGWGHDGRPLGGPIQAPYIPCNATEEGQAGNTYEAVEFMLRNGAVSRTPGLDVGKTRTYLPDGGKIQVFTAKSSSKDGGKETFTVFDETHLYVTPELRSLHATIRRNLTKRKKAEPWALETTTMYAPGEMSVAEASHDYAKKIAQGKIKDPGFLFDHREGTDPSKFDWDSDEQLRDALALAYGEAVEWMDLERIIADARDPQNDRSDTVRYFLNRPAKREQQVFIKAATLEGCFEPGLQLEQGRSVCLGADGSRTYDTTVVAAAAKRDDGMIDAAVTVFSVRPEVAHHVLHEGGRIDYDDVEAHILDRFDFFDVREAAYDPRYLDRSADIIVARLPDSLIFPVFPQSTHMREALASLERAILDGRLRFNGDDGVIAAHFANTRVERSTDQSKEIRRVGKIDERKPIDVVPALAMAVWRAARMETSVEPMVAFV